MACVVLGVTKLDAPINLPPFLKSRSNEEQYSFLKSIAMQVVEKCTIVEGAMTGDPVEETKDCVHNYARVLCHLGSLVMEVRDAWAEGDGERMVRCWRLLLPQFKATNRRKYALEALRLQFQIQATLSPHLAHHLVWDRFINTHGGIGRNIPCDLHNEHINKVVKSIMKDQGSNITESALQRAARSVTTLKQIQVRFDAESEVPIVTSSHSTKSEEQDVAKVVSSILKLDILSIKSGWKHASYPTLRTNPLWSWDIKATKVWIATKKDHYKYKGTVVEGEQEQCE